MKKKVLIGFLIAILSCSVMACSERQPANSAVASLPPKPESSSVTARCVVFYFHRTVRCTECISMELFTDEVVHSTFSEAIQNGTLAFEVVNIDEPENAHYEEDYGLSYSTLVLVEEDDKGKVLRWENLEDAWEKARVPEAFKVYVTDAIARRLP
jgi:hypothetical protein